MNSKCKYAILLISSVFVIYSIIGGMLGRVSAQNGSFQQLSIFNEVLSRIQTDYVDEPAVKDAMAGAIRGMIEKVDPNGGYLSPKEVAFYKDFNPLKNPGIGVVLARRFDTYPVIIAAVAGGPAAKAGLGSGDVLESIDGATTREMNLVQIYSLLSGPVGKQVTLSVIGRRRVEPETVQLNREAVPVPAVDAKMLEGNIAYVRVPLLAPGKAGDARKQLDALIKKGATGIILDLRSTAGGEEKEGTALANLFLNSGTIGYLQGQKVAKETFVANSKDTLTNLPLTVLVNQGTSGVAEVVAGAIADNRRGQIVGIRTFGSAIVQRLIPLEDGSALLIAIAKYYTPTGSEIDGPENGIKPTVEVFQASEEAFDPDDLNEVSPSPKEQTPATEEDRQLKRAIEILKDPSKAISKKAA